MNLPRKKGTYAPTGRGSADQPASDQSSFGARIPPHSIEAEEAVLGSILLDNEAILSALEKLTADDFYRAPHRAIFAAMTALSDRREPIDILTLGHELRTQGLLDEVGGVDTLGRLASHVPSAANVGYYAKTVKEMSLRRRLIHAATEVVQEAFDIQTGVDEFIDSAEQRILNVAETRASQAFAKVGDVVQDSIKIIERLYDLKQPITGTPSGLEELDRITAGLQPSDLIIIAARPSMGKTALALGIAQYVGIHTQGPVAIFSLEMSKEQLVLRALCSEASVDSSKVRTEILASTTSPKLVDAASRIAEAPIFIDDTPGATVSEVRAKARRLHREHPLKLIVVDYLQLMRSPAYSNSREQEIADISRSLKGLAKELHVPVIALSQLNRAVENRDNKRPQMSDLRESGAIEQDADIIAFIYRDEVYHPENFENRGIAELIIGKQRTGPTGTIKLQFIPEYTRFENLILEPSEMAGLDILPAGASASQAAGAEALPDFTESVLAGNENDMF